jgi:hypothetical protein
MDPLGGGSVPVFQSWRDILAAAHDAKQARLIYRGVHSDLSMVKRLTYKPPRARGETGEKPVVILSKFVGIERDGLHFDTVTAEPGSVRGKSAGLIAWDEMLTQRDWDMWEALSPTQSAQRSPLMILTSTAGHADSVVLKAFYDRLLRQAEGAEAPDPTFYGAWWASQDPDAQLDWTQIRQANPALGDGRLTKQAILSEHGILPADSWRRERLNHFVIERARDPLFSSAQWAKVREFPEGRPLDGLTGPYALGIREHIGWERATICVGGIRPDGRVGVEVYRDLRGSDAEPVTAARIIREVDAFPDQASLQVIAFDGQSGGAPEFRRQRDEKRGPWDELLPSAVVSACMDVTEMVQAGRLAVRDPLIDAQVAGGSRRAVGQDGAFRFSVRDSLGPIDAVLGMAFAAHAIAYKPPPLQIFL